MIINKSTKALGIFLIIILFAVNAEAGVRKILFSYPRDGNFKFLSVSEDHWYSANNNYWTTSIPDKYQHYMLNYGAASYLDKNLNRFSIIAILSGLNTAKEIEDGFREGASVRDLAVGSLGMLAGLYSKNMICVYDSDLILLKYYIAF